MKRYCLDAALRAAAVYTVVLLSGCAADRLEHPSYWWNAKVMAVQLRSALAPEVNQDCLATPTRGATGDDPLVVVLRYRVGNSTRLKAYLDTRGEQWVMGEDAFVHLDTCRIKHGFSEPRVP